MPTCDSIRTLWIVFVAAAAILLATSTRAGAATLQVDAAGELLGASDVSVGGGLYDVSFVDGSCIEVFSGCDPAAFAFAALPEAQAAANALLAQVLVDTAQGSFDTQPHLISGCALGGMSACVVFIPSGVELSVTGSRVFGATATNSSSVSDVVATFNVLQSISTVPAPILVYGVFRPASATVPEPGSLLLLAGGCAAALTRLRRR